MPSRESSYFDSIAEKFDSRYNAYNKPAGKLRVKRRVGLFKDACAFAPGMAVLELGCGTGEYTFEFSSLGLNLYSTDISAGMLSVALKKLEGRNVQFFVADSCNLPVRDCVFDAVIGNSILHHLDAVQALRECRRVLKEGGRIAFSEPNMCNPQIFLQKNIPFLKKISGDSPDETAFWRFKMKRLLLECGFSGVKVVPFDFLHPLTPDKLVKTAEMTGSLFERLFLFKEIAGSLLITGVKKHEDIPRESAAQ